MKVRYFALLREATHKREEEWTRPAPDVRTLVNDLVALYGEPFAKWVMKDGDLYGFTAILLDGGGSSAIVLRRDTGGMWAGAGSPRGSCDTMQVLCDAKERALPAWLAFD